MSSPRFHVPVVLTEGARIALPENAAHHAARVLRLRAGDTVTLFNGHGGEHAAVIVAIGKHAVEVETGAHRAIERESPLAVTLVQALSSGERMDVTIQKAVELGVSCIVPVESARSVVRLHGERAAKRATHWQQVAISACEQCGRNRVPAVRAITPLDAWLAAGHSNALRWVLLPDADTTPGMASADRAGSRRSTALRDLPRPARPVELLVGPEGGFTETEAALAQRAGFAPVRLGPRVLRTETAAPALLAAVQALWGDF
jgi:16S rRNA (uracil1498-N3)-methyltransferase